MTARTPRPRKRKTTVEEEIVDGVTGNEEPANDFDISMESVQDVEMLNDVLDQFGQRENVLFRIYKQTPNGNSFCYETTEYNVTFLQRERGAGIYTVRIFINGKFKKSITEVVESPGNTTGTGAGASGPATGDSHAQFLEKLLMVLITQQNGGNHVGPSLTDITQSLANIDALRGKQESGMEMFKQGMEMAKTMIDMTGGGAGDWKTELLRMGREAIPGITSIVQSRTTPAPAVTTVPQGDPVMINPEQMTDEQKKSLLKQTIAYLKNQFIAGLPPESALDFIIANSQSAQYQAVIRAVMSYSFEDIEALDVELKPEQPFHAPFRFIYDGLRSQFTPVDPMDDDTGRDTGDDADIGNNVNSGATRKK
jgi:hypothetical protein